MCVLGPTCVEYRDTWTFSRWLVSVIFQSPPPNGLCSCSTKLLVPSLQLVNWCVTMGMLEDELAEAARLEEERRKRMLKDAQVCRLLCNQPYCCWCEVCLPCPLFCHTSHSFASR